jgi:hypothetical protein
MEALQVVEVQGPRDGVEHLVRDVAGTALFELGVVGGAHPGQSRDLFAAQTRHTTLGRRRRQTDVVRVESASPGGQELTQVVGGHVSFVA